MGEGAEQLLCPDFCQQLLVLLGGQVQLGVQVGAAVPGAEDGLLAPPTLHLFVVAAGEHLGYLHAVPLGGAGVLGVFQHAVPVALVLKTGVMGENPGDEAAHSVCHRHGGDLTAGEDKIPQGDLLVHIRVNEPLINALVVAAHQNQVIVLPGQTAGVLLGEGLAAGGEVDGVGAALALLADVVPALVEGVCLENGPLAAAIGVIIHLLLLVFGVVPNLMGEDADVVPFLGTAQNGLAEHVPHGVREQGHNINVIHASHIPSMRRTLI